MSAGFSACTSCNLYGLQHKRLLRTRHTVGCATLSSLLAWYVDFLGLLSNEARILSTVSLDVCGRPGLFLEHKHPVDSNFSTHREMQFLCGGGLLNFVLKCLCTVTIAPVRANSITQYARSTFEAAIFSID